MGRAYRPAHPVARPACALDRRPVRQHGESCSGLRVTQPAVSKAIAELEHILSVRLLDRGPQGVEATLYGSALVRRGLAVFDELRQGVGEIAFMADPTVGHVRIGCNELLTAAMLPAVISRFSDQYPGVTLDVAQMSRPITVEIRELRERNVDLIIGRGVFPIPEDDLNAEILFEEPLVVVTGAQSPWARRRKIDLAELVDEKWISFAPHEAPWRTVGRRLPCARLTCAADERHDVVLPSP